jgi:hypothetical protein
MRTTRTNNNNNTDSVNTSNSNGNDRGWKAYNNSNAISYGFEYKVDRLGNVYVRHPKRKQRVFSFPSHPTGHIFYLMEHYPTLVGLDNSKLYKLVMAKLDSEETVVHLNNKVEDLKEALATSAQLITTQEQEYAEEHQRETALNETLRSEKKKIELELRMLRIRV